MREIRSRFFSSRGRTLLFAIVLTAVTVFAYRPSWHGGFLWDDDAYVVNNELLTAADGWQRIWFSLDSPSQYFPLTYSSFRIEHALWGLNTTGYHWVNLLLHVGNALLVWAVLARLKVPGSWLAGAIFALHPVQVESVAWITERKNVLMAFFFLLTLLAWILFANQQFRRRWLFYSLGLISYLLALSAKATACTLPVALFLILWLQEKPITTRRLLQISPFVLLAVGTGLLAVWWERYHQGTNRDLFTFLSPMERILVASRAVWFYLSKIFWPSNLTFIYPRWDISAVHPLDYIWLLATVIAVVVICFARRFVGRSVEVGAIFFVLTLSPVLGFIMLFTFRYTFVADHYQYLACIGPIALASAGVAILSDKFARIRAVIISAALLLVAALGTLTWRQAATYTDIETLWRSTLAKNPGCWMAHTNLGLVLLQQGRIDDGIAHYRSALQIQPDSWDAEYNLGTALLGKGDMDEALLHCERAVRMRPTDPDAQVSLGNALFQKGRIDEAVVHYQQAITAHPDHFLSRYSLGRALLEKGELDGAIQVCRSALLLRPSDADCHTTLAIALEENGNPAEAIQHYEKAIEIAPRSIATLTNLAWLLATSPDNSLRNGPKAFDLASDAERLAGDKNTIVLRTLAAAYAENGQFADAIRIARSAMELARLHGENSLATELDQQIALYQLRMPYRETAK
jgi:protein O-mannosyl-transferase